jgi:hypothetical protein
VIVNRISLIAIAGCVALGALALAGCGGGSSTDTTGASGATGASGVSGAVLSKDEFVSQVNSICKDANAKVEALPAVPSNPSTQEIAPYLSQVITVAQGLNSQLAAITPPSELASDWNTLRADQKAKLSVIQKALAAAKADDAAKVQSLVQSTQAMDSKDDQIAKSIGLTECAKSPQPQG